MIKGSRRAQFGQIGLMLMGLLASAAPARADLRVCNESSNPVSIALGYRADRGWQSEGWWVANPSQCAIVFQGDLNSRFYYLYIADDIGGGAWDGDNFMCTRDLQLKDPVNNDTAGPDTGDEAPLEGDENQPLDEGSGDDVPLE